MSVLLIAGSSSPRSRSAALLDAVGLRLARRAAPPEHLHIRDLKPQVLLLAETGHRSVAQAVQRVQALVRHLVITCETDQHRVVGEGRARGEALLPRWVAAIAIGVA